ncbi:MAG: CoA-binding protein [Flavobacteriaceae bacterium]|nr:CoA-binding protein [Flavobacteriaceae bacterium]
MLGASLKEDTYAYLAMHRLAAKQIETIGIGLREGNVAGFPVFTGTPAIEDVHTLSLYINAKRQPPLTDYILSLNPKRVIFNPGTENKVLFSLLQKNGIEAMNACTLVMLATNQY